MNTKLSEIKEEIKDLLFKAKEIVRRADKFEYDRASGYWIAQIETALDKNHDWLGGCMCTMEDTINALSDNDYEEEEDGEEQEDEEFQQEV